MNAETADELIRILGEKKILKAHSLLGSVPLSFAMLVKRLAKRKLLIKLKSSKFLSVTVFSKKYGVSKRTVYRALNKFYKK